LKEGEDEKCGGFRVVALFPRLGGLGGVYIKLAYYGLMDFRNFVYC
jgi:hypothetical protein